MSQVYNFAPGPAMLPPPVLEKAKEELTDWHGSGMSIMEVSHRGQQFKEVAAQAESDFRELLSIPDTYKVLFLQGGASLQFAMVPLNLLGSKTKADYVNTGAWSKKAIAEGQRLCDVNVCASSESEKFNTVPDQSTWQMATDAAYLHYTPNETIGGVEFSFVPVTKNGPLVADMSSTILSRPIDVSKFGVIYAGAQKNIGPAGLTIVIIREDLVGLAKTATPAILNYQSHVDNQSCFNTPPGYSWYLAGLVFQWLKSLGGLEKIAEINNRKATKLYSAIDNSDFYNNPVDPKYRSWMNIPFTLSDSSLDATFLSEAQNIGLVNLKGHRSVGGMRASIYNAMPEEGVNKLLDFMANFEKRT